MSEENRKVLDLDNGDVSEATEVVTKEFLESLQKAIAESTGIVEHLAQQIENYRGQVERGEKEALDLRNQNQIAVAQLADQKGELEKRRQMVSELANEQRARETDIQNLEDQLRNLKETLEVDQSKFQHILEVERNETDERIRILRADYNLEKQKLEVSLNQEKERIQADEKSMREELALKRKKETNALTADLFDKEKEAKERAHRIVSDAERKHHSLLSVAETTAQEFHRDAEAASKRLLFEATQKAAEIVRTARLEAEESRRESHRAEVAFLKEKNAAQSQIKMLESKSKEDALLLIEATNQEIRAKRMQLEQDIERLHTTANEKIANDSQIARDNAERMVEKANESIKAGEAEFEKLRGMRLKEIEDYVSKTTEETQKESAKLLAEARERSKLILESAQNDYDIRVEEANLFHVSAVEAGKKSAAEAISDAEKVALDIVESARDRAANIEATIKDIETRAHEEARAVCQEAEEYADKVRREVPNPDTWESELSRMRMAEQNKFEQMIASTAKNYLSAIDKAIESIFENIPPRQQRSQVVADFLNAFDQVKRRKNEMDIDKLIAKNKRKKPPVPT